MVGRQQNPREAGTDTVARMLAVVPYLIENSPVTVAETATTFATTPEVVRDIVRTLFTTGIGGNYSVGMTDEFFDFDYELFQSDDVIDLISHVGPAQTPRFSGTEAAALVAGLQYVIEAVRAEERPVVAELVEKISSGSAGKSVEVQVEAAALPSGGDLLVSAIENNHQASFLYHNAANGLETRRVDPYRLDLVGNTWYLRAHCHVRNDLRTFRLDRMREINELSDARHTAVDLAALPDVTFDIDPEANNLDVEVVIAEAAVPLMTEYRATLQEGSDGLATGSVLVAHEASLRRLVSRVPGAISVIGPQRQRAAIADWAAACLEHHARDA